MPPGRPTIYSDELADSILDQIAEGESLRAICDREGMPHRLTFMRWLREMPDLATKHAHAREAQADVMDDKILTVADACTADTAKADRVKIDAYKWRAAKLAPKVYGEKLDLAVGGSLTLPTDQIVPPDQWQTEAEAPE